MANCAQPGQSRRRIFWTTVPNCSDDQVCGFECGTPGLRLTGNVDDAERSIVNDDWVRSLIINMLFTDGRRPDTVCGYLPGAQGGHWSESFREDGLPVGTLLRTVSAQTSVREAVNLIKAYAQSTLSRLVKLEVVYSVEIEVTYKGGGIVLMEIEYVGPSGVTGRVGIQGGRLNNQWVWQ